MLKWRADFSSFLRQGSCSGPFFILNQVNSMYDVIVVGGGCAGLIAAKLLSAGGKKVLLLEARKALAGRIQIIESFSRHADGGAEFINGDLETTFALLKEANLK